MAALKNFYTNLDVKGNIELNKNELKNAIIHKVDVATGIASPEAGQIAFDTVSNTLQYYDGATWKSLDELAIQTVAYKGSKAFNDPEPSPKETGDMYIFSTAGTCAWAGSGGNAVVQTGDFVIYDGTKWDVVQGNTVDATTEVKGIVELATDAETLSGTDTARVVTPAGLEYVRDQRKLSSHYTETIASLTANTPQTVTHGLGTRVISISTFQNNEEILLDVRTTGDNTITVESSATLSDVKVSISAHDFS